MKVYSSEDESADLKPEIAVVDYKLDNPAFIEIGYNDMPLNASGLVLCVPGGACTEWIDGTFSPTSNEGTHIMSLISPTKSIMAGEYTIMVIGDSFTDQLFVSEPFILE